METHLRTAQRQVAAPGPRTDMRLIVAHEDEGFITRVSQQFERLGWEVYTAHSPNEVRRLARESPSSIIILPTLFEQESGWLTCAKLVQEHAGHKVILVGPYATAELQRYTAFVGGTALLRLDSSMHSLVEEVYQAAELALVN